MEREAMSNEDQDADDPTFNLEEFVEQADEDMKEEWPFEFDEDGNMTQDGKMIRQSMGWKNQAKLLGVVAYGYAVNLLVTILLYFIIIAGISFLMNLTGVAIPVA